MNNSRTRDKLNTTVNAGSMADIAFLLLIFFLVTTTIAVDKGIMVKLPPYDPNPVSTPMNKRNVYSILVNKDNQLMVRGSFMDVQDLRSNVKRFIMNPEHEPDLAKHPTKAVVSITNDQSTNYKNYLEVYNEVKAAYTELRDEYATEHYDQTYANCTTKERDKIRNTIPLVISEAEPTDYALD